MASSKGNNGSFTGQPTSHTFDGFLFDVDGTIIDTTDAITKHWQKSVKLTISTFQNGLHSVLNTKN